MTTNENHRNVMYCAYKYDWNMWRADIIIKLKDVVCKESLNSDCQQFNQYSQNKQSTLTSNH
jgi:hypothetical protein